MANNISKYISYNLKKKNNDNAMETYKKSINDFIKLETCLEEKELIDYITNLKDKYLYALVFNKISKESLEIIKGSFLLNEVKRGKDLYSNKPKVELKVISEYYANHFNVQVGKEKENHKSFKPLFIRDLNEFKYSNYRFLKENLYYFSQKVTIHSSLFNFVKVFAQI